MYKTRHVYPNTDLGKARAIQNLQWAVQDKDPWYMSCKYTTQIGNADICAFNNWLLINTFDLAVLAIKRATQDIIFYQFDDLPLLNQKEEKIEIGL